ncbi:MAG: hypothetical protein HY561_11865 [Gemmatimonadetes bacterium]|nr:hypothetical protein [Gemmatimonadota bacterium]
MLRRLALVLLLLFVPAAAAAQGPVSARFATATSPDTSRERTGAGRAFLASALLPGAGQKLLGLERWVPYTAVEAWAWARFLDRRSEGLDLERRYRDLAWSVARRVSRGPRRDGEFEYYEALMRFGASGAFDADPLRGGLQPELDEQTFNGSTWALARALFLRAGADTVPPTAPEYQKALEYYQEHAIAPEFAWAWGENGLEQQVFGRLIGESDEARRAATRVLGLILANHVVSAVDALVSSRLRAARANPPPVEIESMLEPQGAVLRWTAALRIAWPRR